MNMMLSVLTKGGMLNAATITPEKVPRAAQAATPVAPQASRAQMEASGPEVWLTISHAVVTVDKAKSLPTERSMPAVMMTSVIPMAMMAMSAFWFSKSMRLSHVRKLNHMWVSGSMTVAFFSDGKSPAHTA